MTLEEFKELPYGTKVVYTYIHPRSGKTLSEVREFGYIGATGRVILYEEGERNMQDAIAVNPEKVTLLA